MKRESYQIDYWSSVRDVEIKGGIFAGLEKIAEIGKKIENKWYFGDSNSGDSGEHRSFYYLGNCFATLRYKQQGVVHSVRLKANTLERLEKRIKEFGLPYKKHCIIKNSRLSEGNMLNIYI